MRYPDKAVTLFHKIVFSENCFALSTGLMRRDTRGHAKGA